MDLAWTDLAVAVGLVLVLEGAAFGLVPDLVRRFYATMLTEPVPRLRLIGAIAVAVGVLIVWAARGP